MEYKYQTYINVTMSPMSPQKPKYFYFAFPEKTFEMGDIGDR